MLSRLSGTAMKYILVTGGVISGVGKGIIASSLGLLLKQHGWGVSAIKIDPYLNIDAGCFSPYEHGEHGWGVSAIKIDPYLNIDAGCFSPYEHGEVFVLADGGEVDLDLGNYERYMGLRLNSENNITTGKIYRKVIDAERAGTYLGKTVQVVPHITDEIQSWVERVAEKCVDGSGREPDVCIVELGGTIGDIEGMPFVEAFRQFSTCRVRREDFMTVHVSLIPETSGGEQKTKPTQMSVASLRGMGLFPDLIMCRSQKEVNADVRAKVSSFCHVGTDQVIGVHDCASLYHVPLLLASQGVVASLERRLKLDKVPKRWPVVRPEPMSQWREMAAAAANPNLPPVSIALVGKYVKEGSSSEAYTSVTKALEHAAIAAGRHLNLRYVRAEDLEQIAETDTPAAYYDAWKDLSTADGILVPGGFGDRGWEGKLAACKMARIKKKPFLGVCLGMQCAAIEVARNLVGIEDASSDELAAELGTSLDPSARIIVKMLEHDSEMNNQGMGGTMRLGSRETVFLTPNSKLRKIYGGKHMVEERHRHRYEVNPALIPALEEKGLKFVGMGLEGHKEDVDEEGLTGRLEALAKEGDETELAAALHSALEEVRVDAPPSPAKPDANLRQDHHPVIRMEICELDDHPYFVGVQYHPEYLTQPLRPSPPYFGLLLAASGQPLRPATNGFGSD